MNRIGLVDRQGKAVDMGAAMGNPDDPSASSMIGLLGAIKDALGISLDVNITNGSIAITSTTLTSILAALQGVLQTTSEVATVLTPVNAVVITSESTLWTPTSGKKFRLLGGFLSYTGAVSNVTLKDGISGATIFTIPNALLSSPFQFIVPGGVTSSTINNPLRAVGTTLQVLNGTLLGTEV